MQERTCRRSCAQTVRETGSELMTYSPSDFQLGFGFCFFSFKISVVLDEVGQSNWVIFKINNWGTCFLPFNTDPCWIILLLTLFQKLSTIYLVLILQWSFVTKQVGNPLRWTLSNVSISGPCHNAASFVVTVPKRSYGNSWCSALEPESPMPFSAFFQDILCDLGEFVYWFSVLFLHM